MTQNVSDSPFGQAQAPPPLTSIDQRMPNFSMGMSDDDDDEGTLARQFLHPKYNVCARVDAFFNCSTYRHIYAYPIGKSQASCNRVPQQRICTFCGHPQLSIWSPNRWARAKDRQPCAATSPSLEPPPLPRLKRAGLKSVGAYLHTCCLCVPICIQVAYVTGQPPLCFSGPRTKHFDYFFLS